MLKNSAGDDAWRMFFFKDTATTEIYTLSLHDALPIFGERERELRCGHTTLIVQKRLVGSVYHGMQAGNTRIRLLFMKQDRKSTRLNSSHANISYAVFCLKKKYNTRLLYCVSYMNSAVS